MDVKVDAPELLRREISRKKRATVWISGVCDPYQPLERNYLLARQCLEILVEHDWPIVIQTRSPLVLRDLDILRRAKDCEVGLSVTTADDAIRLLFEAGAPPIGERLRALDELHAAGIRTYAMIAPILPGAEDLPEALAGKIDRVLLDRMNYHHADWVYGKHGLEQMKTDAYFTQTEHALTKAFERLRIPH